MPTLTKTPLGRIAAIDVFRALTMLAMIFVNDLWSLNGVPHWLEHAVRNEDFLGFSDLVFPCFLFILGMSLPFAIENRINKGDSKLDIMKHILLRSVALLIMGLFTVNTEAGLHESVWMSKPVYIVLMVAAFFMIWNVYPKTTAGKLKQVFLAIRLLGIVFLAYLAFIFRDAQGLHFSTHWWGILGLIGWTYLVCATLYVLLRQNLVYQGALWVFFVLVCILGANGQLGVFGGIIVGNGAFHAFSMAGVLIALFFIRFRQQLSSGQLIGTLLVVGLVQLLLGWFAHSFWIVSKLSATPTWVFYCSGVAILLYAFIHWLVEIRGKTAVFMLIEPAGTATLTCYLMPYLFYGAYNLFNISFPAAVLNCPVGLVKSFAFAMVVIGCTALLGRYGVRLKI